MNEYLKVAEKAALEGGKIFKKSFGRPTGIKQKSAIDKRNIVTDADLAIEKTIRGQIARAFPDHHILGEEFGGKNQIKKNECIWIIDPIDGTNNFAQGIPFSAISIALWDYMGPLTAVVYNPITQEIYTALRGQGAYLNRRPIHVSLSRDPMQSLGSLGWTREYHKSDAMKLYRCAFDHFGKTRAFGSTTLQMCYVADGRLDFYFGIGLYIWDMAAAYLLIKEAGGKVTDIHGKPLTLSARSVVASNGKLHNYIIKNLPA